MNLKKSVPGLSNTHDWFLYDRDLPDERVQGALQPSYPESLFLNVVKHNSLFFYLGFRSGTFAIQMTAGRRGGHLFIYFLHLQLASQALRH